MESLAIKYRPKSWEDVVEQSATKEILQNQLDTGEIKNAYLFCGGAGTGKTTCARIFANEINHNVGTPIELDAASNNSVDDVRKLIDQAQSASIDSEYKVFIMDEVHALSNSAWQAMLKILEEPPKKSIFIMCTTDPQKIPKTILSRVQRYDFQRISQHGIVDNLERIFKEETCQCVIEENKQAIEYIAKLADGGMRDAITMLDKCLAYLAYSVELTIENVAKALGTSDIGKFIELTDAIMFCEYKNVFDIVGKVHSEGKDLKLFIRQYIDFVLDVIKYDIIGDFRYINLPETEEVKEYLSGLGDDYYNNLTDLLDTLIVLNANIKWVTSPKTSIEATLLSFSKGLKK